MRLEEPRAHSIPGHKKGPQRALPGQHNNAVSVRTEGLEVRRVKEVVQASSPSHTAASSTAAATTTTRPTETNHTGEHDSNVTPLAARVARGACPTGSQRFGIGSWAKAACLAALVHLQRDECGSSRVELRGAQLGSARGIVIQGGGGGGRVLHNVLSWLTLAQWLPKPGLVPCSTSLC